MIVVIAWLRAQTRQSRLEKLPRPGGISWRSSSRGPSSPSSWRQSAAARWGLALSDAVEPPVYSLPNPRLIWLEAKIRERQALRKRALLPVRIAGTAAVGVSLGAVASLPFSTGARLSALLSGWNQLVGEVVSQLPSGSLTSPWSLAVIGLTVLLIPALLEA